MKALRSTPDQLYLALFICLAVLLTFATYLLPLPREVLPVLMVFIPTILAVALAAVEGGPVAVRSLLKKAIDFRTALKGSLLAIGLALVMRLVVSLAGILLGWIPGLQVRDWSPVQFIVFALAVYIFALLEEIGWRGYALPKLLRRRSALFSSLVIGLFWGSLHLALHLPGMTLAGLPPQLTLAQLIGLSVLITWVFVVSKGSVVAAAVLHGGQNFFVVLNDGLNLQQQSILMAAVYPGLALLIVFLTFPLFFRRPKIEATASV